MFKKLKNGEKNQIKRLDIKTTRGQEETLGDDEYVHYVACGDGFTGAYIPQNSANVHLK